MLSRRHSINCISRSLGLGFKESKQELGFREGEVGLGLPLGFREGKLELGSGFMEGFKVKLGFRFRVKGRV